MTDQDPRPPAQPRPDLAMLADRLEGRLGPTDVDSSGPANDASLEADIAWLRSFARLRGEVILATPPPEVRAALTAQFAARRRGRSAGALFAQVAAVLRFDSFARPAAQGFRGTGAVESRQLVFSAGDVDIAIDLRPAGEGAGLAVAGQVLATDLDDERYVVQLLSDGHEVAIADTDELGEFRFDVVAPGQYELAIATDRTEIGIERVELGL